MTTVMVTATAIMVLKPSCRTIVVVVERFGGRGREEGWLRMVKGVVLLSYMNVKR